MPVSKALPSIPVCALAVCALIVCVVVVAGCDRNPRAGTLLDTKRMIGGIGKSPGQFVYPRAIATDGERLVVADKLARIQLLDAHTGKMLAGWTTPNSKAGRPTGLTVAPGPDSTPAIYVADTHYSQILVYAMPEIEPVSTTAPNRNFDDTPEIIAQWGSFGAADGQFVFVTDIAVLPDATGAPERFYVSEYGGNDRISVFDSRYQFLFSFGQNGSDDTSFNRPQSIDIEPMLGELIVCDSGNHRVGRFTLEGTLIAWIGQPDPDGGLDDLTDMEQIARADSAEIARAHTGRFRYPHGLFLPGDGTAFITEFGNERVQYIDLRSGDSIATYGMSGRLVGQLRSPWSSVVIGTEAFILDSGNDRVQVIDIPSREE